MNSVLIRCQYKLSVKLRHMNFFLLNLDKLATPKNLNRLEGEDQSEKQRRTKGNC